MHFLLLFVHHYNCTNLYIIVLSFIGNEHTIHSSLSLFNIGWFAPVQLTVSDCAWN